ncbi:MAG: DUF3857 domain-containing protein [Candidatus Cyclobacteriaceae bacterium M3_2C_046]
MLKAKFFVFLWLTATTISTANEKPLEVLQKWKEKYPDERAIYLQYDREVTIDLVGDSIKVNSRQFYDMLHLNEHSNMFASDKIYSSHFVKAHHIIAKTLSPGKRKYKPLEVTNFTEKDEVSDGIFYDDSKAISFVFPAVEPGARTVLDYQSIYTDPRFLNSFYFGSFVPVVTSTLKIRVDSRINLEYKLFNTDKVTPVFNQSVSGNYKVYTWESHDLSSFEMEADAPGISYFTPHIIYRISSIDLEDGKKKVLSSLDDLYHMYAGFIEDINLKDDPELVQVVDTLIQPGDDDLEKVKKVFYWVQDNIKYIAFENGMRGLIPHDASLVCKKRYGDCKDMASIIHSMLKIAGIKSYFTWIGSRDLPYMYSELPTPQVDNHMITSYKNGNDWYFLDATSKYTRFGWPSSMIQGKEALIGLDQQHYQVVEVPVMNPSVNALIDSSGCMISQDKLVGKGSLQLDGYYKVFNTYYLKGLDKNTEKKFLTELLTKGNNKFSLTDYKISNLDDKDLPLIVDYKYQLEDYVSNVDGEIFINMSLDKSYFNNLIELEKKKLPVENEFKHQNQQTTVFEIPAGYEVDYLPQDQYFEHELFGFKIYYQLQDHKIYQHKEIYINHLMMMPESFPEWNDMVRALNETYREVVILKKNV